MTDTYILFSATRYFWLGCNYTTADGLRWVTGEAGVYSNWDSAPTGTQECNVIIMDGQPQLQWGSVSCTVERRIICEKDVA